jgi:hypothetical protein
MGTGSGVFVTVGVSDGVCVWVGSKVTVAVGVEVIVIVNVDVLRSVGAASGGMISTDAQAVNGANKHTKLKLNLMKNLIGEDRIGDVDDAHNPR